MYGFEARPCKPKQGGWKQACAPACHPHSCLGNALTIVPSHGSMIVAFLQGVDDSSDEGADAEPRESEAHFARVKAVDIAEDERECLVEEENSSVDEALDIC